MRINRVAALLPLLSLGIAPAAEASEIGTSSHKFGLGLALGYPTGLSGKWYPSGRAGAVEGVIAPDPGWGGAGGFYLHGVYLWHPDTLAREPGFELPWHVGVGGFLWDDYGWWNNRFGGGVALGIRGQIGLDFDLEDVRLQFSGDLALNLGALTRWGLFYDPGAVISVRYFF